jgi:hypothetical protein
MRSNSVMVIVLAKKSEGHRIEPCLLNYFFLLWISQKFPKGVGLIALGNFRKEKG